MCEARLGAVGVLFGCHAPGMTGGPAYKSPEYMRELAKRGGIASGATRRLPKRVREQVHEQLLSEVKPQLEQYIPDCLEFLVSVVREANDPEVPRGEKHPQIAFKACELLMAYMLGKPRQEMDVTARQLPPAFLWEHPAVQAAAKLQASTESFSLVTSDDGADDSA